MGENDYHINLSIIDVIEVFVGTKYPDDKCKVHVQCKNVMRMLNGMAAMVFTT